MTLSYAAVPLKSNLKVWTRSLKLDYRAAKVETFEFENRVSRTVDFEICINSRFRESDLCLEEMNNYVKELFVNL